MRKILLTSSGFETTNIQRIFLSLINKKPEAIKAIFVPTAANTPDAIAVLPKCMNDLLNVGISPHNITVYDLHYDMKIHELQNYDVIYFTGGSPEYLLQRINETGFYKSLKQYVDNGGVFVGVSAGSIVAANNFPNNLGFVNCTLGVHKQVSSQSGIVDVSQNPHIDLDGENVLLIMDNKYEVTSVF